MQIRRIVAAVDFSEASTASLHWCARHLARGAELVLVHVLTFPEPPPFLRGALGSTEELMRNAREGARVRLRALGGELPPGLVWAEVREGVPAEQIADVARAFGADLILMGPHRRRPEPWDRLGTTAQALLSASAAPLLIVSGDSTAPHTIVAAVDGSSVTSKVLRAATDMAAHTGSSLIALHVVDATAAGVFSEQHHGDAEAMRLSALAEMKLWMEPYLEAAGVPPQQVEMDVAFGDPERQIMTSAEQHGADLVVVATHGRGRTRQRRIFGSVASRLLRSVDLPLLIVGENASEVRRASQENTALSAAG